jgi:hypothetical protein
LYEWKGIKKLYAHIIRQIENGLADWTHDFSEVETPLLIKYAKIEQRETLSLFLIYGGKNISAKGLSLLSINFELLPKYVCSLHVLFAFI